MKERGVGPARPLSLGVMVHPPGELVFGFGIAHQTGMLHDFACRARNRDLKSARDPVSELSMWMNKKAVGLTRRAGEIFTPANLIITNRYQTEKINRIFRKDAHQCRT